MICLPVTGSRQHLAPGCPGIPWGASRRSADHRLAGDVRREPPPAGRRHVHHVGQCRVVGQDLREQVLELGHPLGADLRTASAAVQCDVEDALLDEVLEDQRGGLASRLTKLRMAVRLGSKSAYDLARARREWRRLRPSLSGGTEGPPVRVATPADSDADA